jgi:prepilin-type N-terminal cleavage/methylation domain-containing protein
MKNKGLTLIEILVVMAIIVIATGIIVIDNSSKEGVDLFNTTNSIRQNISKAKEMAMSGVGATLNKAYGIGVWFPDTAGGYYYIYRNHESTAAPNRGYDSGDIIIEKITLPDGIKYARKGSYYGALFTPPTPHVAICSSATACAGTLFELYVYKESDKGVTAKYQLVKVNAAGLIE